MTLHTASGPSHKSRCPLALHKLPAHRPAYCKRDSRYKRLHVSVDNLIIITTLKLQNNACLKCFTAWVARSSTNLRVLSLHSSCHSVWFFCAAVYIGLSQCFRTGGSRQLYELLDCSACPKRIHLTSTTSQNMCRIEALGKVGPISEAFSLEPAAHFT